MKKLRVIAVGLILAAACLFYCFLLFIGMSGDGTTSGVALTFGDALLLFSLVPAALGLGLLVSATVYLAIDDIFTDCYFAIVRWMFDENERGRELLNWLVPQKQHTVLSGPTARREHSAIHFERDPTAARLSLALCRLWVGGLNRESLPIPDDYRELIHTMVINLRNGREPGDGINPDEPWKGVPTLRVLQLEAWLSEAPIAAWTFITLLVAGEPVNMAWTTAESEYEISRAETIGDRFIA